MMKPRGNDRPLSQGSASLADAERRIQVRCNPDAHSPFIPFHSVDCGTYLSKAIVQKKPKFVSSQALEEENLKLKTELTEIR